MSSHHVIRDEQEPPVVIISDNFDIDVVNDLLGWSPLLIVKVELLYLFHARNIKVDAVIYSNEEMAEKDPINKGFVIEQIDKLSSQKILTLFNNKVFTGVNIFCDESSKDHFIENINEAPEQLSFPVDLFVGKSRTIICPKKAYTKWYTAGSLFEIDSRYIEVHPPLKKIEGKYATSIDASYEFKSSKDPIILTEI